MNSCPLCCGKGVPKFKLPHTVIWECQANECGLQFASPQLEDHDLARAYTSSYYPSIEDTGPPKYETTPDSVLRQVLLQLQAHIGSSKSSRLLDYGCGRGPLSRIALELGLAPVGIEPDPVARGVTTAEVGIPVYANLSELYSRSPAARFDLIILWNVIEHMRKPWAELQEIRQLLKPGGWLLISTMNAKCLRARIERERWSNYQNPTHLYYFDRDSLQRVIRSAGFLGMHEWKPKIRYPHHGMIRRGLYKSANLLGISDGLCYLCSVEARRAQIVSSHKIRENELQFSSTPIQQRYVNSGDAADAEAGARANLLHITPLKWCLVRTFETLMRFLKPLTPPLRPFENPKHEPASILVIEYWNLGDLAILVTFLRNLRRGFPTARVSLLINPGLSSFLEGQGIVDETIPIRVPWARHFSRWRKYNPFSLDWVSLARTILELRKRQWDWAFSGRMDVRDNFILWLTGARRRIGYGIGGGGSFLTDQVRPDVSRPHRADVWLHLLEAIDVSVDRKLGHFRLTDSELSSAQLYLAALGVPPSAVLIGVHPGARIAIRRWGEERFAEVARRVLRETDAHILWFSEPGNSIQAPSMERCHAVSLDFGRFLAVLSRCQLLICNDSGPMHLANLLRVPVVAVFGPTSPVWFGPRGPRDRVVIRPEFSCRPCFDYCIFEQPLCLKTISTDEVYNAVKYGLQRLPQESATRIQSACAFQIPMGTAP